MATLIGILTCRISRHLDSSELEVYWLTDKLSLALWFVLILWVLSDAVKQRFAAILA